MGQNRIDIPTDLLLFAETDRERSVIRAVIEAGAIRTAAAKIGAPRESVRDIYRRVEHRCIQAGKHPALVKTPIPLSLRMSKTTVHVHSEKGVIEEWRRLHPSAVEFEAWAQEFSTQVKGAAPRIPLCRKAPKENILRAWLIGDHHLGMRAWGRETNDADHDTKIGLRLLRQAAELCLPAQGEVQKILLVTLGDFWHADTRTPVVDAADHG